MGSLSNNTNSPIVKTTVTQIGFWQTTYGILLKRILFLAVSAAIGGVIGAITNDPKLFGASTPLVYVILTTLRDLFDKNLPNSKGAIVTTQKAS